MSRRPPLPRSSVTLPAPVRHRGRGNEPLKGDRQRLVVQVATTLGVLVTGLGLFQLVLNEFSDLIPLLVISPIGVLGLVWLAGKLAEGDDRSFLLRAMAAGLLLRVGLTMVIHYTLPVEFFAPDQFTFQDVGWRTVLYHRGQGPIPWQINGTAEVGYFYWNSFLFVLFGYVPLAPKLVNAFVGTASALVAYRLAGELAGGASARLATLLTMFFPSLVLWSTLNLRDPMVLLVTLALFLSVAFVRRRPTTVAFFGVVLSLSLLVTLRDYVAVMALMGLLGSTFISRGRGLAVNVFLGLLLFGMAVVAYQQFGLGTEWVESASFAEIAQQRQGLATGGSAFRPDVDVSTPLRGLQYFPLGLAFFLLSPFPWQVGSALAMMTLPEQLVWYAMIPMVMGGGMYLIRHRYHVFGPMVAFLALTTSIYALAEGNVGTAYRHRAQVLVFFLIIAAVGITLRKVRRAEQQAGRRNT